MSQGAGGSKGSGVNSSPGPLLLNIVTFLPNLLQVFILQVDFSLLACQMVWNRFVLCV